MQICRTTCSVREDKLCPPSPSKSSFARSNSSVSGHKKGVFRLCPTRLAPFLAPSRASPPLNPARGPGSAVSSLTGSGRSLVFLNFQQKSRHSDHVKKNNFLGCVARFQTSKWQRTVNEELVTDYPVYIVTP